ncbi:uncharacterized protein KGF55_000020 [Candida pseudojiufengensis]|uniref:uncharacterized protein n=1 Tax=Candida pseudojiufengensis TaxID=497109 RepID=UPI00222529D3|nr:uncharacterized protein KGF55_000020 [Candida pseudojiufengensis]KAI5968150.1 hypothetical protein KGF55_000020 [Candida pseudojiufengensis]
MMYKSKSSQQSAISTILQKLSNVNKNKIILIILSIWFLIFWLNESFLPFLTISKCKWPKLPNNENQTNILLIADPQLIDNHTYPGRNSYLLKLSQHTVDQYLKRNYQNLLNLKPKYTIFLGDLLDNGRGSKDEYFNQQVERFYKIFPKSQSIYTNLPGNHDIGFGDLIKPEIKTRFENSFGKSNIAITINEIEFIMLDSISLSSSKDLINHESKKFLNNLKQKPKLDPRILLTHVPLYRDPTASCGPNREKLKFDSLGYGYQYQNSLTKEISSNILKIIKPDLIFSGDDHDYCDYLHKLDDESQQQIREITIKSISMAMGIWYPAVQLLSFEKISDPTSKSNVKLNYKTEICYLQTPYYNIITYIILSIFTFIFIIYQNLKLKLNFQKNNEPILPFNNYKVNTILKKGIIWDCFKDCFIIGGLVILIYRVFIVK